MPTPPKGRADYLQLGDYNAVCFECGRKRKASELKKHWQGYYVCKEHWEPRQPQDFVKAQADIQTVPWSQPAQDAFIASCSISGISGIAGYGVAGCSVNHYLPPSLYDYINQYE